MDWWRTIHPQDERHDDARRDVRRAHVDLVWFCTATFLLLFVVAAGGAGAPRRRCAPSSIDSIWLPRTDHGSTNSCVARVVALLASALAPALALQPPPPRRTGSCRSTRCRPASSCRRRRSLIGAYAFFLLLMMFYLWTIWRRLGKVEAEMRELERRQGQRGPGR